MIKKGRHVTHTKVGLIILIEDIFIPSLCRRHCTERQKCYSILHGCLAAISSPVWLLSKLKWLNRAPASDGCGPAGTSMFLSVAGMAGDRNPLAHRQQWQTGHTVIISPAFSHAYAVLCFPLSHTEAPPSGMSKNGYFFQEMGEYYHRPSFELFVFCCIFIMF